ncbi:MAG: fatty acid desaturase [Flavipsychrobacter sp.]|jgi:omega-6 fatty acid desaturase (delta-12 desaturase)|nr:fatty acid desaturase [Flavipsychrobacter sp.]
MTGRELILATKPFAKEIRSKSWLYLLSTLAMLLVTVAGTLFLPHPALKLVSSVLMSLLMLRMFVIYHDHQHHSILYMSVIADVIMSIFGVYILAPTSIWKRSHDYHHNHNSKLFSASIGSYPIATKSKFESMSKSEQRLYLFVRHPLTILFGYFTMFIYGMCISSFTSSPKKHWDSLVALIVHGVIIYALYNFAGWQGVLFTVFIPFFISSAIGAYLFYAQHNFPSTTFSCKEDWKYEVAALESSSHMLMHPFMRFMTANIGYHHIHHLNSRIPFYRLPEVYKAIPELQKAKTTSLAPREIAACFRLKVWDPELNKMTGID